MFNYEEEGAFEKVEVELKARYKKCRFAFEFSEKRFDRKRGGKPDQLIKQGDLKAQDIVSISAEALRFRIDTQHALMTQTDIKFDARASETQTTTRKVNSVIFNARRKSRDDLEVQRLNTATRYANNYCRDLNRRAK